MTPTEFKDWRKNLGLSQLQAAAALGLSRRTVIYYEHGELVIPKTVCLAMVAVDLGLDDYTPEFLPDG